MRGKGSGRNFKKEKVMEEKEHVPTPTPHTHSHRSLLSYCFGRHGTPKVIMKFNYNSQGVGMEMSFRVSVSPGAVK